MEDGLSRREIPQGLLKAREAHGAVPSGFWGTSDVAAYLDCSKSQVTIWVNEGILSHDGPERRTSRSPFSFRPNQIRDFKAKKMAAIRKRSLESRLGNLKKRSGVQGDGELSVETAALRVNVSEAMIRNAVANGELKAYPNLPLSFSKTAVDDWIAKVPAKAECDVQLTEIPLQVRLAPGDTFELMKRRMYYTLNNGKLAPTYLRRCSGKKRPQKCIHLNHLSTVIRFLERKTAPDLLAGKKLLKSDHTEMWIRLASRHFGISRPTIRRRLAEYAPTAGRLVKNPTSSNAAEIEVYPTGAIESALRGRTWSQPEPTNGLKTTLNSDRRDEITSPNGQPPNRRKSKGGRPAKWARLLAVYDELHPGGNLPLREEVAIRKEAVANYNNRYARERGFRPVKMNDLRQAIAGRKKRGKLTPEARKTQ